MLRTRPTHYQPKWEEVLNSQERKEAIKKAYLALDEVEQTKILAQIQSLQKGVAKKYGRIFKNMSMDGFIELLACVGMWMEKNKYDQKKHAALNASRHEVVPKV